MKKSFTLLLMAWVIAVSSELTYAQSTEIRPGVILPQMNTAQRTALSATNGMLVFDTNTQSYWLRSNNAWTELPKTAASTNFWEQSGAAGNEIRNTNSGGFWSANPTLATSSNPATAPVSGAGTRMMWIPSRSAFRVGTVDGTQWDANNIGTHSIAMGRNTIAGTNGSIAIGDGNESKGTGSIALGYYTTASGNYATAIGFRNFDNPNALFMVGNGGSLGIARSNILTVTDTRVGIRKDSPLAPLHVGGGDAYTSGLSAYIYPTNPSFALYGYTYYSPTEYPISNGEASIIADKGIVTATYLGAAQNIVASDERIKDIIGLSDNASDLTLLQRLRITNYRMKDRVQWGERTFKKVIAQQVEEVFPQAITYQKSCIPDIYKLASAKENYVFLPQHTLKVGEKVKLILNDCEEIVEIASVERDGFRVCSLANRVFEGQVFVYGREVSDFRSVDYEALSMLGISAIQQLAKENEMLKSRLSRLESLVENLVTAEAATKTGK